MKRMNGCINIDEFLKENGATSLDISDLDFEGKIKVEYWMGNDRLAFWFKDGKKEFLFKVVSNPIQAYLELVCEKIANQLNIPCAHYEIATFQGEIGVVTENFKKENKIYKTGQSLLTEYYHLEDDGIQSLPYNNLENILEMFKQLTDDIPNKDFVFQKLANQLITVFIFDLIINQSDRKPNNWGVEIDNKNINMQVLFDNQESFGFSNLNRLFSLFVIPENYYNQDSKEKMIVDFLTYFPEYKEILKSSLEQVNIKQAFKSMIAENQILISDDIQNIIEESFTQNKKMIMNIIEEYKSNLERDEQDERESR